MRPRRLRAMPRATPASRSASRTRADRAGRPSDAPARSSNGRSARDSRFVSIGAPTVAPWVVMEPWSKSPSTRPVSWSAQTTTGDAGQRLDRGHRPGRRHGHRSEHEDHARRRGPRTGARPPTPSSADAISTTATGSIGVREVRRRLRRASASRSARKVGPAVCSQSVQYGWTTATRGRGPAGLSGIVSPGGRSRRR